MRYLSIITVIIVSSTIPLCGQINLAAPMIGQRGQNLCWAASMEMVLKYYDGGSPETQCTIAERFQNMINDNAASCASLCIGDCNLTGAAHCDRDLPGNSQWSGTPLAAANYDLLFSKLGFNSMEDLEIRTWAQCLTEFEQCRPIIFNYSVTGYNITNPFNHSVVSDGYLTIGPVNYLRINDPWGNCTGDEYLINENVLLGAVSVPATGGNYIITINWMLSSVHHIFPKTDTPCKDCGPDAKAPKPYQTTGTPPDILGSLAKEHQQWFIGTRFGEFVKYDQVTKDSPENHFRTPVFYLSQKYIEDPKPGPLTFGDAILKSEIYEMTYTGSKPALVATMRCAQEAQVCFVEKIGLNQKEEFKRVYLPGNEVILLTNDPEIGKESFIPVARYAIVRYPPYPFEFYRFAYKGKVYWYPIGEKNKFLLYGPDYTGLPVAIPEDDLFNGIGKYTKDESKIPSYGQRQIDKLNRKISRGKYLKVERYLRRNQLDDFLSKE